MPMLDDPSEHPATPVQPSTVSLASMGNDMPPVDSDTFRAIMGSLPTGVCVVSAIDQDNEPRGLTCNAVCSLSQDPPLVLVCVNLLNESLNALRGSRGFVVNVLREDRRRVSQSFASRSPDKFDGVFWEPSSVLELPLLTTDALVHAECRIVADLQVGDHAILVGMIVGGVPPLAGRPLMYWDRGYSNWPDAALTGRSTNSA
ncbi:flavin reductase family protein [Parasphingorhabdus pacifica]